MSEARVAAIVPTLGASPYLGRCLAALRDDGGESLELVVVDQGERPAAIPAGLGVRVLRLGRNRGFASGTNRGIAVALAGCEWIATVNDDAIVEPGWTAALAAALAARPEAGSAQGVNLQLDESDSGPGLADGWGLRWNRDWQAVQMGHGLPPPDPTSQAIEVFGVSATAALYRRSALLAAALPDGRTFDERLGSYYEDADLAGRLRAAGYTALSVPAARARHAGSATAGRSRLRLVYRNRLWATAHLLGSALWRSLPAIAWRDARDLARALARLDGGAATAILGGWTGGLAGLPQHARRGEPAVPLSEIARFR